MLRISLFDSLRIYSTPDEHAAPNGPGDAPALSAPAQALLVYLALNQEEHARTELAQLLWTAAPGAVAHHGLDGVLDELQHHVGDCLDTTPHGVAWRSDAAPWVDVLAFAQKSQSAAPGELWPDTEALEEAVALYAGDLWATRPTAELTEATGFTAWLLDERVRWRQRMVRVLETLADEAMAEHQYEAAIAHMERLLQLDPAHEAAHHRIMLSQARLDQIERALAQYERCVVALAATGRTPAAETRALCTRIELASLDPHYDLPGEATSFVGRGPEQAQLHNMLLGREANLITLTGLGGIGKTRLALEVARQIVADPHRLFLSGVLFVPLVGVATAEEMPLALLDALGLTPAAKTDPVEHLLAHLRPREMLLLLDNVEHLLGDASPAATLMQRILDECPDVTLLVTSRIPLLLMAEWRFDVAGLSCTPPAPHAPDPCAATQLFTQAARRAQPDFQLDADNRMDVYRLCDLVSGIPLAIELAAAWSNTLTTAEIVERVQNNLDTLTDQIQVMPPRQRSMRVVLDYTWSQLDADQQAMLRALSLCRAPFSEAAAAHITQQDPMRLPALVEHNLLQMEFAVDGMRYEMHELIRQYGAEKLAADPAAGAVRQRHARFYLALLAEQEDALFGDAPHDASVHLRQEVDNLRTAWQWATAHLAQPPVQQQLARSAEALAIFYENVGWVQEGERRFEAALAACDALGAQRTEPGTDTATDTATDAGDIFSDDALLSDLVCQLLVKTARFAELRGDNERVEALTDRARALAQRTGNTRREADALRIWGRTLGEMGELAESIYFLAESVERYRTLARPRELAIALNALGSVYLHDQNTEAALRCTEEALQLHTAAGNRRGSAFSISQLGNIYYYRENFAAALAHLQQALEQFQDVHYSLGVTRTANNVGYVHWRMGAPDAALPYLERSLQMARQMGIRREEGNTHESLGSVYRALGQYERAERSFRRSLEQAHEVGWQTGVIWGNLGLGLIYQEKGDLSPAQSHLQRALEQAQLQENEREVAICMGHLGAILAQMSTKADRETGSGANTAEEALAQLDEASDLLLNMNSPYEAAPFLVERAQLLLDLERLPQAEAAIQRAVDAASASEHRDALHRATLLRARLAAAHGDLLGAKQRLHAALAATDRESEQADLHYLLWHLDGSLEHARRAHGLYTELYAQRPLQAYQKALQALDTTVSTSQEV